MTRHIYLVALLAIFTLQASCFGQETVEKDHMMMHKDHVSASSEHLRWNVKISKMRAEHQRALAALARMQAEVLEHEAELGLMSLQIQSHELEMTMHDQAMDDHEKHGKGENHNHLKAEHTEIMGDHAQLKTKIESSASHHDGLIKGILEFSKKHMKEFHSHEGASHSGHGHDDHKHDQSHSGHGHDDH